MKSTTSPIPKPTATSQPLPSSLFHVVRQRFGLSAAAEQFWLEKDVEGLLLAFCKDLVASSPTDVRSFATKYFSSQIASPEQVSVEEHGASPPGFLVSDSDDAPTVKMAHSAPAMARSSAPAMTPFSQVPASAVNGADEDATLVAPLAPRLAVLANPSATDAVTVALGNYGPTSYSQVLPLPIKDGSPEVLNILRAAVAVSSSAEKKELLKRAIGVQIDGRFLILDVLGAGGCGAVFKCHDTFVLRDIAVKVSLSQGDNSDREFLREATITSMLSHVEYVMNVYHFGVTNAGMLYQIMELLQGKSLAQVLKEAPNGRLNEYQAMRIGSAVLDALIPAHNERIIHRDIKPDNIYVGQMTFRHVNLKVIDWGTAYWTPGVDTDKYRWLRTDSAPLQTSSGDRTAHPTHSITDTTVDPSVTSTRTCTTTHLDGTIAAVGTLRYMAIQQFKRVIDKTVGLTAAADLFALGVTIYQIINGHLPPATDAYKSFERKFMHYLHQDNKTDEMKTELLAALKVVEKDPVPEPTVPLVYLQDSLSSWLTRNTFHDSFCKASSMKSSLESPFFLQYIDETNWMMFEECLTDNTTAVEFGAPINDAEAALLAFAISTPTRSSLRTVSMMLDTKPQQTMFRIDLDQVRGSVSLTFEFNETNMTGAGLVVLAACLKFATVPHKLSISNVEMSATENGWIAAALQQNIAIGELKLDNCVGSESTLAKYAEALQHNTSLTSFSLENVSVANMDVLLQALSKNTTLRQVSLCQVIAASNATQDLMPAVSDLIRSNKTITSLSLVNNNFTSSQIDVVLRLLSTTPVSLTELNLSGNDRGVDASALMVDIIRVNPQLSLLLAK
eukprot:GILJ01003411.1.p1 GENE.GILJ01003411.1~~GILJ01003411.1.p1  ORF type:complete len:881 (-),score=136.12 GILJ01003411.1:80-2611(-)